MIPLLWGWKGLSGENAQAIFTLRSLRELPMTLTEDRHGGGGERR